MRLGLGNNLVKTAFPIGTSPSLDLAFALDRSFTTDPAAAGNALITSRRGPAAKFSRGTGATQVNAEGLIEYAPENLSLYSGALVPAVGWNAANVTSTPDGLSHDGGVAYQVSEAATSSDHAFVNTGGTTATNATSVSGGIIYTASIFFKKVVGSIDWVQITTGSAGFGSAQFANFNIGSGTVGNYAGLASGTLPVIESYGNGWYRCSISVVGIATVTNSAGTVFAFINNINGTTRLPLHLGSTTNSVLAYGAQLERASTARTYNPTTSAVFYGPRFDYDPATGASKGLLIEDTRTNLVERSEAFNDAYWTKAGGIVTAPVVTADQVNSPSGVQSADRIVFPAVAGTNAFSLVFREFTQAAGVSTTQSIYLRGLIGGEKIWIMWTPNGTTYVRKECVLTTSWQRFDVTYTSTSGLNYFQFGVDLRDASQSAQLTQTIFAWGAQLEAGAFPLSYIPTTSGTAIRSADVCSIIGTDFSSFWNSSEVSIFSEASVVALSALNSPIFSVQNGTTNIFGVYHRQSQGNRLSVAEAANQNTVAAGFNLANVRYKCAFGVSSGSSALYMGGSLVPSTFVYPYAAADNLKMSGAIISGNVNAHISRLSIYRKRLSNAKLQTLTTP